MSDFGYARTSKGLFTVSVSISICGIAMKWLPLISMVLFTLSNAKLQGEKSLPLNATLTVNRPLGCKIKDGLENVSICSYFLCINVHVCVYTFSAACNPGQFRDPVDNTCEPCTKDTYNSEKWVDGSCTDCGFEQPSGRKLGTVGNGATSAANCTGKCFLFLNHYQVNNYIW